jgi:hypothetical protein
VTTVLYGLTADNNGNVFADSPQDGPPNSIPGMKADGSVVTGLGMRAHFFTRTRTAAPKMSPGLRNALNREELLISESSGPPRLKLWMNRETKRILEMLASDPSATTAR